MTAFTLQWQTELRGYDREYVACKAKIFSIWPFTEKLCPDLVPKTDKAYTVY